MIGLIQCERLNGSSPQFTPIRAEHTHARVLATAPAEPSAASLQQSPDLPDNKDISK
jgi:hypothetical protein